MWCHGGPTYAWQVQLALFSLGRQLLYFHEGDGPVIDPKIVDDAVAVFIAAVAATQEDGASWIVRLVGAEFGEAMATTLFITSILLNPTWTNSIPILLTSKDSVLWLLALLA